MTATGAAPLAGLRLVTHRPHEMATFWAALLDGHIQPLNSRQTAVVTSCGRILIEHSAIAFDYHPETCGVTGITIAPPDEASAAGSVNRLAHQGFHPHRATDDGTSTALWYHDPNQVEIALQLPSGRAAGLVAAELFAHELDPAAVLDTLLTHRRER